MVRNLDPIHREFCTARINCRSQAVVMDRGRFGHEGGKGWHSCDPFEKLR